MLDIINNYWQPIVGILGAIITVAGVVQQRIQSREDQKRRKEDLANWQSDFELKKQQVDTAEQHNQTLEKLYIQISETNDPITRQRLEFQYNEQLKKSNTLEARLTKRQNALEKQINDFYSQMRGVTTNNDLVRNSSNMRDLVDQAKSLFGDVTELKKQIDQQIEQGLNLDQVQREILRNIGQALQTFADEIAPPTIRRTSPQDSPSLSTWNEER